MSRVLPIDAPRPAMALLSTPKAAAILGVSSKTLMNWRWLGADRGPAFVRVGRAVRYDVRTLDAWVKAREFRSTSAADHATR